MRHLDLMELIDYPSENVENNRNIEEHFGACTECKERYQHIQKIQMLLLRSAEKMIESSPVDKSSNCLDYQIIAEYVESVLLKQGNFALSKADKESITNHLEKCDRCLNIVLGTYQMLSNIYSQYAENATGSIDVAEIDRETEKHRATRQAIAKVIYITLIASYIFNRKYVRQGVGAASSKNRLEYEDENFLWTIYQEENDLIFSVVEKSKDHVGKYIAINITSANKVDYRPGIIQWEQDGPEKIGSDQPINSRGWTGFVIAQSRLDMDIEEDFNLLQQIFQEIELKIFAGKSEVQNQ